MFKKLVLVMLLFLPFVVEGAAPDLVPGVPARIPIAICLADEDCASGEFCLKPLGDCAGVGECVERLADEIQCLALWDPVCGCDGQTYSNGCYAMKAGVSINHVGECGEVCDSDDDCLVDQFCATPLGDCDAPGECIDRLPDVIQCFAVWDPVCGCDGQTYSNGCYAMKAAVSIDYPGECGAPFPDDDAVTIVE